ncbi:PCI domain-containing protein [Yarrowia sp. B02]|nr:PCI domain-containing protein [Yarrowia sp. B02]
MAQQLLASLATLTNDEGIDLAEQSEQLAELFTPLLINPTTAAVRASTQNWTDDQISKTVEQAQLFDGGWAGFEQFVSSYIRLVRDFDPFSDSSSFDLVVSTFNDLQVAFSSARGGCLIHTVALWARKVVSGAFQYDREHNLPQRATIEYPTSEYIATPLLRLFNTTRTERSDLEFNRKNIILHLACLLCRVYFHIRQPTLCANVFSNMSTAGISLHGYPKSQQVEYRFYLGKFYWLKSQLKNAYIHLDWSWRNCYTDSRNKRLILKHLVAVSLLLGIIPTRELLEQFSLDGVYGEMVKALKNGNHTRFYAALEQARDWFIDRDLYVLIKSRAFTLLNRGVLKTIYEWSVDQRNPAIPYATVAAGLDFATQHGGYAQQVMAPQMMEGKANLTPTQVEAILVALIDQGFIKGKLQATSQRLIHARTDVFPPISAVLGSRQSSLELKDDEKWMTRIG